MKIKNNWFKFLISLIICEMAGVLGSAFTMPAIKGWYAKLIKPAFNPPAWIFGPVWTTLYLLMGVALYLVWSKNFAVKHEIKFKKHKPWNKYSQKFFSGRWQKANIVIIFWLQLFLNILWSVIFFGLHQPGIAFFELLTLWFSIIYLVINFYRVSKPASYLLSPYLLWVTFAAILNYSIWILNL